MRYMILLFCLLPVLATAARLYPEKHYRDLWCDEHGGTVPNTPLPVGTYPDCLTSTHAVEVDFSDKWAESIGQALHYGAETGLRPGIVLVIERPASGLHHLHRLHRTIQRKNLNIDVWIMEP